MDIRQIVASTTDPTFAIDQQGQILAWNGAAEELFGYRAPQVLGRRCWGVLSGQDVFGNRYCCQGCPLIGMAARNEAVHRCQLVFQTASGDWRRVEVSTLVVFGERLSEVVVVHHLYQVKPTGEEAVPGTLHDKNNPDLGLTPRERELLGLLAEGKATAEIAELLCISSSTARSHIRHILRKLRVHSRLQAVALGHRLGVF